MEATVRSDLGGSKGTFFVNGNNWGCIYDYADQIIAAHNAGWLTWDQAHNELWLVEQAMIKILGLKPLYFRPPYGESSDTLLSVLANRGYKSESPASATCS
jgi:peptidoglycan/xylan/chitin deacetylase (PgdA/CDA1 family)